jgi:hypothetical protein
MVLLKLEGEWSLCCTLGGGSNTGKVRPVRQEERGIFQIELSSERTDILIQVKGTDWF